MRVLHVTASMSPEWGGPVTAVAGLTAALARLGVNCEIVTTVGRRVGNDPIEVPGVPMHRFGTNPPARLWTAWSRAAAGFLADEAGRFDLVHVHEPWHHPGCAAFRAARRHGVPFLLSVHGGLDPFVLRRYHALRKRLFLWAVQDRILKSADAVHALTDAEREVVRARGRTAPVFVAPNGVSPAGGAEGEAGAGPGSGATAFLARHPRLAGKRILLFLSRLQEKKNLEGVARGFIEVASGFPDAALLVAGLDEDGTARRAAAILERAGIAERAVFTGPLTGADKAAAFACADAFVLPSHAEGFSNAVLEALAAGLPVVISHACHFPEVAEREAGFVVEADDHAALAGAVGALLADDGLRGRMGRNARRLVQERYDWPTVAESFLGLYRRLASHAAPPASGTRPEAGPGRARPDPEAIPQAAPRPVAARPASAPRAPGLRVLHVTASMSPEWGGPVTAVAGLTEALAQLGVACEILTTVGRRVGSDPIEVPGVPMHRFATDPPARLWTAWSRAAAGFLAGEAGRFDLIHVHEPWHHPGCAAFRAARRHGVPFLLSVHGGLDPFVLRRYHALRKRLFLWAVQDRILKSADAVHALTDAEREAVRARGCAAPVFVASNGVSAPGIAEGAAGAEALLARHPRLAGKRILLFLGRLQGKKNLEGAARGFIEVASRFPDAALLVAGPDEDGSGRRAAAILADAGMAERAVFAGLLTGADKAAAFACAEAFVLPSHSEGFSVAVLEALAAGLPVVISHACHFPEVAERDAGFVVEAEDTAALAGAVCALLEDEGLRARMGRNARRLAQERHGWPMIAESFLDLYRRNVRAAAATRTAAARRDGSR